MRDRAVVQFLCRLPHRAPWALILTAAALAAIGGIVQATVLEIRSGRRQLSDPESRLNKLFENYRRDFGVEDQVVWVVSSGEPEAALDSLPPDPEARRRMKAAADAFAANLASEGDDVPEVLTHTSPQEAGPLAPLYLPDEVFDRACSTIEAATPTVVSLAAKPTTAAVVEKLRETLNSTGDSPSDLDEAGAAAVLEAVERFFDWIAKTLQNPDRVPPLDLVSALRPREVFSRLIGDGEFDPDGYQFIAGGRFLIVPLAIRGDTTQPNQHRRVMQLVSAAAEHALATVNGEGAHLVAGFAGEPALEAEEVAVAQRDFARGAPLALLLVSALFAIAFGGLLRPALAALCLAMSVGATFTVTWLSIGHMNLVAMVFAVILIALGIDFAIHLATHYEHELASGPKDDRRAERACEHTLGRLGGVLLLGGLTTAAAFFAGYPTPSPGLSELGLTAGFGLLICIATMMFVYPAMLVVIDRARPAAGKRAKQQSGAPVARPSSSAFAASAALIAFAVLGYMFGQYRFDTNLLSLQPTNGHAARWSGILAEAEDRTQFAVATYDDRASLEAVREALLAHPDLVRSAQSVFPDGEVARRAALRPLADRLRTLEVAPSVQTGDGQGLRRQLFGLRSDLRHIGDLSPQAETALTGLRRAVDRAWDAMGQIESKARNHATTPLDTEIRSTLHRLTVLVQQACDPPAFAASLAPKPLRDRFVGTSGRLALVIHPTADTWQPAARRAFVEGVTAIEPGLFDGVVAFEDNAQTMVASFRTATGLAILGVVVILLIGLRSVVQTALALVPLTVATGALLGVMRWAPPPIAVDWNFANFFALATLIGIGVDSGVHLTAGWRHGPAAWRAARQAVFVSTMTTILGFAVLAGSVHLGVRSLGLVLTLGIGLVLLASLVVMPCVLALALGPVESTPEPAGDTVAL